MPNITHPSKTYKLTDESSLVSSNFICNVSNFSHNGDIYADAMRRDRYNFQHVGLVVNDINAIPTKYTTEGLEKSEDLFLDGREKSCNKLKGVFNNVIQEPGLVFAVEKLMEQTYLSSFIVTKISYEDNVYGVVVARKSHEDFVYSFAKDSDDSFTFTTLRKQVVSDLFSDQSSAGIYLNEDYTIKKVNSDYISEHDSLQEAMAGKVPIYTFTEETHVTFKWLDLNEIKEKVDEFSLKVDDHNLKKVSDIVGRLKGVKTINGLTNYITENCGCRDSLTAELGKLREEGEFSLYFQKKVNSVGAGGAVDAKFISKEEAEQLGVDKYVEFKFTNDKYGVVLPQFFLESGGPKENHLRISAEGRLQMVFQDKIKRETHFQIDDRFNAINDELGFKKEGKKVVGLDFVSDKPCYSDAAHIAKTIELISKVSEEHSDENPLLLGDPDDQIKQQIEEHLDYKIGPLMAKPEFKQDMAAINVLSESLGKISSVLKEGNKELKAKVDEKIKTLETYKNLNNEVNSNRVSKIAWYASAFILVAAALAIFLFVSFPPVLAVLVVAVPVVCGVASMVSAEKGYECQDKESKAKSALGGEGLSVVSEGHSGRIKSGSMNQDPKGSDREETCPVAHRGGQRLDPIPEESPAEKGPAEKGSSNSGGSPSP